VLTARRCSQTQRALDPVDPNLQFGRCVHEVVDRGEKPARLDLRSVADYDHAE
jgi:hypothetical protein